jgi:hypothetical protein
MAAGAQASRSLDGTVSAARASGVSEAALRRVLVVSVENGVPADAVIGLLESLIDARRQGFPAEPYLARLEEGLQKRVPVDRIHGAIRTRLEEHRFIRRTVEKCPLPAPALSDGDLAAFTDSLDLGLGRDALEAIICHPSGAPLSMRAVAAEMKAYMLQIGFDGADLDRLVDTGLTRETLGEEWRKLPILAASAVRRGISRQDIARTADRRLGADGKLRRLLPELEFTGRHLGRGPAGKPDAPRRYRVAAPQP